MAFTDGDSGTGADGGEQITDSGSETGSGTSGAKIGLSDTVAAGVGVEGQSLAESAVSPTAGTPPYGDFPYGEKPYGGGSLADASPPVVTITSPAGVVADPGPNVTVAWTYFQAQGRVQSGATVRIINNRTGNTVVTRQVIGTATSLRFNAVSYGMNANSGTSGRFTAQVTVIAGDPGLTGTASSSFDLDWGQPTVTITQPSVGGSVYAPSTPVSWQYSDSLGLDQATFDLTLYDDSGRQVANGGITAGNATTATLFFYPVNAARYSLKVTATNTNGVPGTATVVVTGDNPAATGVAGQPQLSAATERWYDRLPAFMRDADTGQDPPLPLLSYMALLGEQQGAVEGLYDRMDWVPPNEGGPDPASGLAHSRSDLVSPLSADDAWLPWLGNVLGVPQADRSPAQWRVAMIPRPDPGGAYQLVTDPTTGEVTREPLMLYPYGAGSKGGIKQAVQDIYAQSVTPATLIEQSTVINAGYAPQPVVAPRFGASWSSPDGSALVASTASGFDFVAVNDGPLMVVADNTDDPTLAVFAADARYTFQVKLTAAEAQQATLTVSLRGSAVTNTATATLTDSPGGTVLAATVTAPAGVEEVTATLVINSTTAGETHHATGIATLAPIFTDAMVGGNVYGLGVAADTTIVDVLGPVSIEMSQPAEFTVPAGIVVVVPRVAVAVTDHWLGNPWVVNVAVPVGTDPAALTDTLAAQQPAGVIFTITYGVLTWQGLYDTYGDGREATWIQIEGNLAAPRTWDDLERELT